ncbi:MAG: hypothetical protein NTX13_06585 [Acidobacteria bacterium]|nr:hypothetical protein [Acidobacteriota bacterium]
MRLVTSDSGYIALAAFLITAWFLIARPDISAESNWPFCYYGGLIVYLQTDGSFLQPVAVYAACAFALIIRFEFLSAKLLKALVLSESACLAYILWQCFPHFITL